METEVRVIADFSWSYWDSVLTQCRGNVQQATILSGRNRTDIYKKLKRLGVEPRHYREGNHEMLVPVVLSEAEALRQVRRGYWCGLLFECKGNITQASRIADRHRSDVYKVLSRLGMPVGPAHHGNSEWQALGKEATQEQVAFRS